MWACASCAGGRAAGRHRRAAGHPQRTRRRYQPHLEVVGEATDGGEALRRAAILQPDVILLDHHLPGVTGVNVLQGLREAAPAARVPILTVSEEAAPWLRRGAHGYLLKTVDSDVLVTVIERAHRGVSTISPEMTDKLVNAFRAAAASGAAGAPVAEEVPHAGIGGLSPREREILGTIAAGASNKEIGRALSIAETTVRIHVQHILRKLGLSSRVQAAVLLAEHGCAGNAEANTPD